MTLERCDWYHTHQKAVRRSTQMRNQLLSYLSDHGVRLVLEPELAEQQLRQSADWSPRQWQVIQGMLLELRHAEEQRRHWCSLNEVRGVIHRRLRE